MLRSGDDARKKKRKDFLKKKGKKNLKNESVTTNVKKKMDLKRGKTKGKDKDGD